MKTLNNIKLLILLFVIVISACQPSTTTNKKAVIEPSVFFKNIPNGAVLSSPFIVDMGVDGMEVEPSGKINANKGHHHIIINKTFIYFAKLLFCKSHRLFYGLNCAISYSAC